jgi:hypothetical protein
MKIIDICIIFMYKDFLYVLYNYQYLVKCNIIVLCDSYNKVTLYAQTKAWIEIPCYTYLRLYYPQVTTYLVTSSSESY